MRSSTESGGGWPKAEVQQIAVLCTNGRGHCKATYLSSSRLHEFNSYPSPMGGLPEIHTQPTLCVAVVDQEHIDTFRRCQKCVDVPVSVDVGNSDSGGSSFRQVRPLQCRCYEATAGAWRRWR